MGSLWAIAHDTALQPRKNQKSKTKGLFCEDFCGANLVFEVHSREERGDPNQLYTVHLSPLAAITKCSKNFYLSRHPHVEPLAFTPAKMKGVKPSKQISVLKRGIESMNKPPYLPKDGDK